MTSISVREDAGTVQVCAILSRDAAINVTVTFDGQGLTATGTHSVSNAFMYNVIWDPPSLPPLPPLSPPLSLYRRE